METKFAVKIAQNDLETDLNGIGTESWNVVLWHQTLTHLVLSYDGSEVWGCEDVGEQVSVPIPHCLGHTSLHHYVAKGRGHFGVKGQNVNNLYLPFTAVCEDLELEWTCLLREREREAT